ncbi:mucin-12-like [Rana temporaria]|uniref:mucin-12-like n=1 Tax=Rana temporaria TaxID=8407 RepID=UPI001AADFB41|nr:mucin-12-like [Rana temporaria]
MCLVFTELCMETIPEGFKEFYSPYFSTDEALTCISDCEDSSEKYKSCNKGTCQIRKQTGRACLCPDTEIYLYMYSDCKGPILKSGVYGGVGAAIAVLSLALITVTYLLFRRGKDKKLLEPFAIDQEDNWSEENDSEWHVDRGITNLPANVHETNGDSSNNISSREKFKPTLDKIDTTIEIKIQRPEVARL